MKLALLIFALVWPLQYCVPSNNAPAQKYVTVRKVGAAYAAIDTFSGATDSLRMTYGSIYRVHGRALGGVGWNVNSCGDPATQHDYNLLALDWTGGSQSGVGQVDLQGGLPNTGVAVYLAAPGYWQVTVSFGPDSLPTRIVAKSSFDYNHDGKVNLSDLTPFAVAWVAGRRNLSFFQAFGECYQRGTRQWP